MERDRRGTEAGSAEMQRAMDCRTGIEWRNLKVEAGVRGDRPHSRAGEGQSPGTVLRRLFSRACSAPHPLLLQCAGGKSPALSDQEADLQFQQHQPWKLQAVLGSGFQSDPDHVWTSGTVPPLSGRMGELRPR